MNKKGYATAIVLLIFLLTTAYSQPDSYYLNDARTSSIDTLAYEHSQQLVKETSGLLEKEVIAEKYILGPGDFLTVSIIGVKNRQATIPVSPEGKLLIPEVGVVDLKKKTLAEAEKIIQDKVQQMFKAQSVSIILSKLREFKVIVSGSVARPAIVHASAVDRVSEVIEKAGGFKNGSVRRIQIVRDGCAEPIKVDLLRYFILGIDDANPMVLGGDRIIVPSFDPNNLIYLHGEVPTEGVFEFIEGDSLSTLIRFGHGFTSASYLDSVEIVRYGTGISSLNRWFVDLNSWNNNLTGNSNLTGDFPLRTGDRIYVRRLQYFKFNRFVSIAGEVNYPGRYAIEDNQLHLLDVIERSGGYTTKANPELGKLFRRSIYGKEDKEMERLMKMTIPEMNESERRYFKVRYSESKDLLSLDIAKAKKGNEEDILIVHGDSIYIPRVDEFVSIQGKGSFARINTVQTRIDISGLH